MKPHVVVFVDQVFWRRNGTLSTDESYALFLASFAREVSLTLIGRAAEGTGAGPYCLPAGAVQFLPLPFYSSVHELWRAGPRFWLEVSSRVRKQLDGWDILMVSGPNPVGQFIAQLALHANVPLGLIVRQNLVEQMRSKPYRTGLPALMAAWTAEKHFRHLAKGRLVLTVGSEMERAYRTYSRYVINHCASLITQDQYSTLSALSPSGPPSRLLCVARLSPEKGHTYLLKALAVLKSEGLECTLDIVGTGDLEASLRDEASDLGIGDLVTFHGYVPFGPALFAIYERSGTLVLASLTEGLPQVINEALTVGLPTVATAVGGIPSFLTPEVTALLVLPKDVPALTEAIRRLVMDQRLRQVLKENGRLLMSRNTMEENASRVIDAIRAQARSRTQRQGNGKY